MINAPWASADFAGGWKNHYLRMLRWSERALQRCNNDDEEAQSEIVDFALAFFVSCFSMRDWIKNSGEFSEEEEKIFIAKQLHWKYCRDIAIRHKHCKISNPGIDANYGISRELDWPSDRIVWNLWIDGKKIRLSEVIASLAGTWKTNLDGRLRSTGSEGP